MDGELDLVRNLEIEQHLQECSACAATVARHRVLQNALHDPALYHRPPARLRERIRSSLPHAGQPSVTFPAVHWRALRVAAAVAFVALLGWGVVHLISSQAEGSLAEEVVSDHARSLMPGNLLGFVSTEQHRVKPWFNDKVEFSPTVKDLKDEGFPLKGGRLEYLDKRRVAVLIYGRREHIINVFVWPAATDADTTPESLSRQGYHLLHWNQGGLTYWAVSDLNERELAEFVELIRR
jgi:anti-sigma factor RsiW